MLAKPPIPCHSAITCDGIDPDVTGESTIAAVDCTGVTAWGAPCVVTATEVTPGFVPPTVTCGDGIGVDGAYAIVPPTGIRTIFWR